MIHDINDCDSNEFERNGWAKVRPQSYKHPCGARVTKRGRLWTATSINGETFAGHLTALQAMRCLEDRDSSFWSYGEPILEGDYCGVWFNIGHLEQNEKVWTFVCSFAHANDFSGYLKRIFERELYGKAYCAKCQNLMAELVSRVLRASHDIFGRRPTIYLACRCGHPTWCVDEETCYALLRKMKNAERYWRRQDQMRAAGGKHTRNELRQIAALQENRCIYCDRQFTSALGPTADHLLAIAAGGTDWALNIIIACKRCNCSRGDIPFRTYCTLLSKEQNKKILVHLGRRVQATDIARQPKAALRSFDCGLQLHNPDNYRFQYSKGMSRTARQNVLRNQLLPGTRDLIAKEYVRACKLI
jgi:5-methylcytosine-specific restriction endonuclease McrA